MPYGLTQKEYGTVERENLIKDYLRTLSRTLGPGILLSQIPGIALLTYAMKGKGDALKMHEIEPFIKSVAQKLKIETPKVVTAPFGGGFAAYDPLKHRVITTAPVPASVLAHEVGHGASLGRMPRYKRIISQFSRAGLLPSPLLAAGLYVHGKKLREQGDEAKGRKFQAAGILTSPAIAAPTLYEEAKASILGTKALRQIRPGAIRTAKWLLPLAWASYAAVPLFTAGYLFRKYKKAQTPQASRKRL